VPWKEEIKRYFVASEGTLNRRDPRKKKRAVFSRELRGHDHVKAKDVSKADRETMNGDLK
jgi:hypothetical protein